MKTVSIACLLLVFSHQVSAQRDLTHHVNPFIGTAGHGHTFPGAIVPFGMVQLSPDTRLTGWDGCSGYHYSDSNIYGFSHTHLSGTGISDYGDVLLLPMIGRRETSRFQHQCCYASQALYKKSCAQPSTVQIRALASGPNSLRRLVYPLRHPSYSGSRFLAYLNLMMRETSFTAASSTARGASRLRPPAERSRSTH